MSMDKSKEWIAIDLDRTLVRYDEWVSIFTIGEPLQPMVDLVKMFLRQGKRVKIFTSRVAGFQYTNTKLDRISGKHVTRAEIVKPIHGLCMELFGTRLEVTAEKDENCVAIYDDIAIRVERNTGKLV